MKKSLILFLPVAVFATTLITTVHTVADLQEHALHLFVLGTLSLLFILYVLKDTIKIKNGMMLITVLLLLSFCTMRVFSCHLITENPQDLAQATVINNPCCSAVINALPTLALAPTSETVTPITQEPVIAQTQPIFYNFFNKPPPTVAI